MTEAKKKRGGKRAGAGRPKGSGRFNESTQAIRVPKSLIPVIENLMAGMKKNAVKKISKVTGVKELLLPKKIETILPLALYSSKVSAGFPSPADDHVDRKLDLNELLVKRPSATFFVRVEGESMLGAGIRPNDILVVDRSTKPINGKIIIAVVNGELTVKKLKVKGDKFTLLSENSLYPDIEVTGDCDFSIWGVVTSVIHEF